MVPTDRIALAKIIADWLTEHAYLDDRSANGDLTDVLVDASGGEYLDLTELADAILEAIDAKT